MATSQTEQLTIRPYQPEDFQALQEIAGSVVDWTHVVDVQATHLVVAELGGEVVGYAFVQVWQWNQVAWLGDFVVDERFRGRGIGWAMIERLMELVRKDGCRCLMDHPQPNHPVVTYYLRKGFRLCGYNDSYLSEAEGHMAVFMAYDLNER